MMRIAHLLVLTLLLSSTACVRRALDPTFAKVYRNIMAAQSEGHPSHVLSPVRGDEAKRVIRAYYGTISDNASGTDSAAGSGGGFSSGQTPPSPQNGQGNSAFNFKVR